MEQPFYAQQFGYENPKSLAVATKYPRAQFPQIDRTYFFTATKPLLAALAASPRRPVTRTLRTCAWEGGVGVWEGGGGV